MPAGRTPRGRAPALLGVLLAVVLAGCGDGDFGGLGGSLRSPIAAAPLRSGLAVAVSSETFVDTHNPTPSNGTFPQEPSRTLVTTIVVPLGGAGPFPLIVFSHGYTGSPAHYDQLLRAWGAAGYVVAAPTFPLSNGDAPGGPTRNDIVNQPADVSFVITQMLRLAADPTSNLHGLIDRRRIGAAGHSMGGVTTLGVALDTCCRDYRVAAAVIMAGNEFAFPKGAYPGPDHTPVLFMHGSVDEAVPYNSGLLAYFDAHPPKFFVTLEGSGHTQAFTGDPDRADDRVVAKTTIDFFDRYLKQSAGGLARLRQDGVVSGIATLQEATK